MRPSRPPCQDISRFPCTSQNDSHARRFLANDALCHARITHVLRSPTASICNSRDTCSSITVGGTRPLRINRAHRIGCKSQVIVSKFICKETIEEKIDQVLRQKREMFAQVLGAGDNERASLSLSAGEIFGLFNLKARAKGGGTKAIGPKQADAA